MSDLHFGKKTTSFSPERFEERLVQLSDRLQRIRKLFGDYIFDELVLAILGDANDGTGIYPTQLHHQEITDPEEQAEVLAPILADFARKQKVTWGNVRIEAVPGNHGRMGRFAHEAANWDRILYKFMHDELKHDGIAVNYGKGNELFMRIFRVRQHRYLQYHGHGIRMYQNIPWYGIAQRALRWSSTQSLSGFDVMLLGHFHGCGVWEINRFQIVTSGTMVTDDEWALQEFGFDSVNKWVLFGVSDSRPMTWEFRINL